MSRTILVFSFAALAVCVLTATWLPAAVVFKPYTSVDMFRILASLLFVSLLLERALEIFINASREPGKMKLELAVQSIENRMRRTSSKTAGKMSELLEKTREQRTEFKSQTQRIALSIGILVGWVVALVGVRSIEFLVESRSFSALPSHQRILLKCIDVLLTGSVIAGGSEGIHKIMTVYSNFMDSAAGRMKQQ